MVARRDGRDAPDDRALDVEALSSDDGDSLITYTPNPGFDGPDSFTFQASDGWVVAASASNKR